MAMKVVVSYGLTSHISVQRGQREREGVPRFHRRNF